jgi:hypothetical protein
MEKPRVRFCWECGRKLWGNHFVEAKVEGHMRILHKKCFKERQRSENINRDWPPHGNT